MDIQIDNLRSQRSNDNAYVRFVNRTDRTVEVIWINFTGSYVSYQILEKGRFVDINTYKKHPWIALDHFTRDRLHIDKEFVYFPQTTAEFFQNISPNKVLPPDFEARIRAIITLPLYSLKYACLLAIRNVLKKPEDINGLELPKELLNDLEKVISQRNNLITQQLIRIG